MELIVLDTNFVPIDLLDSFESLIWTDRYCEYGDFEIYTKPSEHILRTLKLNRYVQLKGTDRVMVIEDSKPNDDVETGHNLIITGRSLESILDRRIVWNQTILTGSLQDGIKKLINDSIITPLNLDRTIPNFIFEDSDDPQITSLIVDTQIPSGSDLYETIRKLCESYNIGFMVSLTENNKLCFTLYSGVDRSYDQTDNSYVIFSPTFDNLLNNSYLESVRSLKTVSLVVGEGEVEERMTTVVGGGEGLDRREMFTDASDIGQDTEEALLSDEEYLAQLAQKGNEDLAENSFQKRFEGQLDTSGVFTYGKDFFLGDIVQIVNEYGVKAKARVSELIHSQSLSGNDIYPTFTIIE